jgi:hypothetical protein
MKASLRDDCDNGRLLNSLSFMVIDIAPTKDFRNVIKSDSIVPFKYNLMGFCATY